MRYAGIVVDNNSDRTDEIYSYGFSKMEIAVGEKVLVPFGNGNRLAEGYVFSVSEDLPDGAGRIKEIYGKSNDMITLTDEIISVCIWMKDRYFCRYIDAVQCFVPPGSSGEKNDKVRLLNDLFEASNVTDKKIIAVLREKGDLSVRQICCELGNHAKNRLSVLKKNGVIEIKQELKRKAGAKYIETVRITDEDKAFNYMNTVKNAPKQKLLLKMLFDINIKEAPLAYLYNSAGIEPSTAKALAKKGFLVIEKKETFRIPGEHIEAEANIEKELTIEQETALEKMAPCIDGRRHKTFLLHGVTGSGKTEIYMRMISRALQKNRTALVLVPEISLAMQMIERFKGRFGSENIAILHSKLSLGERYDEWTRIRRGDVRIVIGARSAIFAPLSDIGIIIADEEHEGAYKSEYTPKYDAIEIAKKRAELQGSVLILGSATPSVVSFYRTETGEYEKVSLTKRYNETPLPDVDIVDMREELKNGNKSIFSVKLYNEMKACLDAGNQIILFLNRRGYASFVSCRSCGYVVKCPECQISLTYHSRKDAVICHFCGHETEAPKQCPGCGSRYIKYFGIGTEKVEEVAKRLFPEFRTQRLDLDTARKKGSTEAILSDFKKGKTHILIGTQIVAKGLDFKNVALVGIVAADITLNIPDYRSAERTFQLITQAAGRAGRGDVQGRVIIQSYNPQNYAIVCASTHNYEMFYRNELILREQVNYPPFSELIQMIISGEDEAAVADASDKVFKYFINEAGEAGITDVMGPQPAPVPKSGGKYRYRMIIRCGTIDRLKYLSIINNIKLKHSRSEFGACGLSIDINPYSFM